MRHGENSTGKPGKQQAATRQKNRHSPQAQKVLMIREFGFFFDKKICWKLLRIVEFIKKIYHTSI